MHVELSDISKSFGSVEVVKNLNLSVAEGEFLVLLGPSGCGKTTALRMLAGLETVSAGAVRIGGRDVTHVLPKYRDIAMVFQSYALYPHMTVAENIGYPLKLRKQPKAEREQAVRAVAAKVHLEDFLERRPGQLSGGQRQRVALARAMVRRPSLFLMDEPLSNLDAKLRGHMRSELKHLQKELGTTTIYVTHDQIEAMTLADRVAVLSEGKLQQLDTPRNIYGDPANLFVAGFMGSPPMNFLSGRIEGSTFHAEAGRVACAGFADCPDVTLGLRPEDLEITLKEAGVFTGSIFANELTGNETIVTCTVAGATLVVRMDKDFDEPMGSEVGIALKSGRQFFFDGATGRRLHPA